MPRSIVILFPHPTAGSTGGYKVIYEYANRLVDDGYDVHIVYQFLLLSLHKITTSGCGIRPTTH